MPSVIIVTRCSHYYCFYYCYYYYYYFQVSQFPPGVLLHLFQKRTSGDEWDWVFHWT